MESALFQETEPLYQKGNLKNPAADLNKTLYNPERQLGVRIIEELSKCEWIEHGKNLVIIGKTSSGKSYLANALCICALRQFKTARYVKANQLINELSKAEKLDTYQEELALYAGYNLLVVDDFGLMNMDINKCRNLFEVFDNRDPHKFSYVSENQSDFSVIEKFCYQMSDIQNVAKSLPAPKQICLKAT